MFYSVFMVLHFLPAHMCVPEVMQHRTSPISPSVLTICSSYDIVFGFVSSSDTFLQNFDLLVQSSLEACWVPLQEYQFIIWCFALHTLVGRMANFFKLT